MAHFKVKKLQKDIITIAVGYYLRYREVFEIMSDRGINVYHTTIYRWI